MQIEVLKLYPDGWTGFCFDFQQISQNVNWFDDDVHSQLKNSYRYNFQTLSEISAEFSCRVMNAFRGSLPRFFNCYYSKPFSYTRTIHTLCALLILSMRNIFLLSILNVVPRSTTSFFFVFRFVKLFIVVESINSQYFNHKFYFNKQYKILSKLSHFMCIH